MKKCYLDSNILVYIKNESSSYHKDASKLLSNLVYKGVDLYISPLVLDEFLHAFAFELRHNKTNNIFVDLKKALTEILKIPLLTIINPPTDPGTQIKVVSFMEKYHLGVRDSFHLLIMRSNIIDSLATFDNDFRKVFRDNALIKA